MLSSRPPTDSGNLTYSTRFVRYEQIPLLFWALVLISLTPISASMTAFRLGQNSFAFTLIWSSIIRLILISLSKCSNWVNKWSNRIGHFRLGFFFFLIRKITVLTKPPFYKITLWPGLFSNYPDFIFSFEH